MRKLTIRREKKLETAVRRKPMLPYLSGAVVILGCCLHLIINSRGLISGYSIFDTKIFNVAKSDTGDGRLRKFTSPTVADTINSSTKQQDSDSIQQQNACTRWAISDASLPEVDDTFKLPKSWCVLLVEEASTPPTVSLHDGGVGNRLIMLSEKIKEIPSTLISHQSRTLSLAARNREKHLGYLYAISQGAKFIVDLRQQHGQSLQLMLQDLQELIPKEEEVENIRYVIDNADDFVPYKYFHQQINADEMKLRIPYSQSMKMEKVGMIKILAQEEDEEQGSTAIQSTTAEGMGYPVLVPPSGLCTFRTETTMYTFNSFWALLLPSTIPEDSRELWIAHVTYAFFREMDLRVLVTRPLTRKREKRTDHSIGDTKTKVFRFLRQWSSSLGNTPARIEQLWIDLYEYGFIEYGDVISMQYWLSMLSLSDYQFPKMNLRRFPNIALMGQFNFPETPQKYMFWHQNWRSVFDKIVIRGAFDNKTQHLETLRSHGIEAYVGRNDRGFFSPIENLMRTLYQFENSSSIDGVVYIHDDAILNISEISPGFANDEIVVNTLGWPVRVWDDYSYIDPREIEDKGRISKFSFKVFENGTIVTLDDQVYNLSNEVEQESFYRSLKKWDGWPNVFGVPAFIQLAGDPGMDPYRETDGSILVSPYVQADFMYVPTKYAREFGDVAKLFLKYDVFLECAAGNIVDILRRTANAPVRRISLCTIWRPGIRGTSGMAHMCNFGPVAMSSAAPFGVYHPIKTGNGIQAWADSFNNIKQGLPY